MQFQITFTFKDSNGNTAVLMKTKETLVQKSAFSQPLIIKHKPLIISLGSAHTKIIKKIVVLILMSQVAAKLLSRDKINFKILQMI